MRPSAQRYRRAHDVVFRAMRGEVLVAGHGREDFDRLIGGATAVWLALEEASSVDEIVGVLSEAFDRPATSIRSDVEGALEEMRARGLVEVAIGDD